MDKICIVKLRKKLTNPAMLEQGRAQANQGGEGQPVSESPCIPAENRGETGVDGQSAADDHEKEVAGRSVSLVLTPEQLRVLQANPNLLTCISGATATGSATAAQDEGSIVFRFAFEPAPPMRLLKMDEVVHMLRISKGYLAKIVRQGELKSYKIGRLRRIKFDDVLTYLEENEEFANIRQRDARSQASQGGGV